MVLRKTIFISFKEKFIIKKDLNDKVQLNFAWLHQIDQSAHRTKSLIFITTAEYSHSNCTTKIDYAANATEFKETSRVYM